MAARLDAGGHPELAQVAALGAAIALNLAVILIATRPIMPSSSTVIRQLAPVTLVRLVSPPAIPTSQIAPRLTVTAPAALSRPAGRIAMPPLISPAAAPGVLTGVGVRSAPI